MHCLFSSESTMLEQWSRSSSKELHLVSLSRPQYSQTLSSPSQDYCQLSQRHYCPCRNQPELSSSLFSFRPGLEPAHGPLFFSALPQHPVVSVMYKSVRTHCPQPPCGLETTSPTLASRDLRLHLHTPKAGSCGFSQNNVCLPCRRLGFTQSRLPESFLI